MPSSRAGERLRFRCKKLRGSRRARCIERFGDRKVFIASLWTQMLGIEAQTGGTLTDGATIEHFKAWLLRTRLLTRDGTQDGARLVVLCRADLVAAMEPARVAASETLADGAAFHFVLDPAFARQEYAPRVRARHAGPRSGVSRRWWRSISSWRSRRRTGPRARPARVASRQPPATIELSPARRPGCSRPGCWNQMDCHIL